MSVPSLTILREGESSRDVLPDPHHSPFLSRVPSVLSCEHLEKSQLPSLSCEPLGTPPSTQEAAFWGVAHSLSLGSLVLGAFTMETVLAYPLHSQVVSEASPTWCQSWKMQSGSQGCCTSFNCLFWLAAPSKAFFCRGMGFIW